MKKNIFILEQEEIVKIINNINSINNIFSLYDDTNATAEECISEIRKKMVELTIVFNG